MRVGQQTSLAIQSDILHDIFFSFSESEITSSIVGRRRFAANFGVSQSEVSRLYQRYLKTAEVAERHIRGRI